jgi:hypothetical protein
MNKNEEIMKDLIEKMNISIKFKNEEIMKDLIEKN